MAGYSKRPLTAKLGIKPGMRLAFVAAPDGYENTLGPLPDGVERLDWPANDLAFIHFFARDRAALEASLLALKAALLPAGMLWVSWPKRASNVGTDLTGDAVRTIGLAHGLVDVKIAAVDETWSALKFVYRLKDRASP